MAERIGALLVRKGLLAPRDLEEALRAQLIYGGRLGTILVELEMVSLDDLANALSEQLRYPAVSEVQLDAAPPAALKILTAEQALKHQAFPFALDGRKAKVAMAAPNDPATVDAVSFITGLRVIPFVVPELRLSFVLDRRYGVKRKERFIRLAPERLGGGAPRRPAAAAHLEEAAASPFAAQAAAKEELFGSGSGYLDAEEQEQAAPEQAADDDSLPELSAEDAREEPEADSAPPVGLMQRIAAAAMSLDDEEQSGKGEDDAAPLEAPARSAEVSAISPAPAMAVTLPSGPPTFVVMSGRRPEEPARVAAELDAKAAASPAAVVRDAPPTPVAATDAPAPATPEKAAPAQVDATPAEMPAVVAAPFAAAPGTPIWTPARQPTPPPQPRLRPPPPAYYGPPPPQCARPMPPGPRAPYPQWGYPPPPPGWQPPPPGWAPPPRPPPPSAPVIRSRTPRDEDRLFDDDTLGQWSLETVDLLEVRPPPELEEAIARIHQAKRGVDRPQLGGADVWEFLSWERGEEGALELETAAEAYRAPVWSYIEWQRPEGQPELDPEALGEPARPWVAVGYEEAAASPESTAATDSPAMPAPSEPLAAQAEHPREVTAAPEPAAAISGQAEAQGALASAAGDDVVAAPPGAPRPLTLAPDQADVVAARAEQSPSPATAAELPERSSTTVAERPEPAQPPALAGGAPSSDSIAATELSPAVSSTPEQPPPVASTELPTALTAAPSDPLEQPQPLSPTELPAALEAAQSGEPPAALSEKLPSGAPTDLPAPQPTPFTAKTEETPPLATTTEGAALAEDLPAATPPKLEVHADDATDRTGSGTPAAVELTPSPAPSGALDRSTDQVAIEAAPPASSPAPVPDWGAAAESPAVAPPPSIPAEVARAVIAGAQSPAHVMAALLRYCQGRFNRAFLLTVTDGEAKVAAGFGEGCDDPSLKELRLKLGEPSWLQRACETGKPLHLEAPEGPVDEQLFAGVAPRSPYLVIAACRHDGAPRAFVYGESDLEPLPPDAEAELQSIADLAGRSA